MTCCKMVWGINDPRIQHRLFAEGSLTFVKALEIGQASELASHDPQDLQASGGEPTIHKVQREHTISSRSAQKGTVSCFHCGGNHQLTLSCCTHARWSALPRVVSLS